MRVLACYFVAVVFLIFTTCRADSTSAPMDCEQMLEQIWSNYTNPAYITDSCDTECLESCEQTLQTAIYSTKSTECPPQADIARCFNYFSAEWTYYAQECELFSAANTYAPSSSSEGESQSSSSTQNSPSPSPSPPPPSGSGEGEGGSSRRLFQEGEGESSSSTPSPSPSPPPPAASSQGSEGEGESSTPATIPPPSTQSSSAEGEAGSTTSTNTSSPNAPITLPTSCFPQFTSIDDFKVYMNGQYWTTLYYPPTNTAGVIMSVFFWVGLAAMGYTLRH